jgi:hypothetical protein
MQRLRKSLDMRESGGIGAMQHGSSYVRGNTDAAAAAEQACIAEPERETAVPRNGYVALFLRSIQIALIEERK